jgi:hypothetical protein
MLMYVKGLAILLLLSGVAGAIWWHNSKIESAYDNGKQAGRDEVNARLLEASQERDRLRSENEALIGQSRIVYRDRIKTIERSVNNFVVPADIERVLCEAGVFTGC